MRIWAGSKVADKAKNSKSEMGIILFIIRGLMKN
jgi:hypothetical protein